MGVKKVKTTKLTDENSRILTSQGMDRLVFREKAFDPYSALTEFRPKIENVKTKKFGLNIQAESMDRLFANPLKAQTICISGFPSDVRAKAVAAKVMEYATMQYKGRSLGQNKGRALPKWHRVIGGYHDPIRDAQTNRPNPSFLVISNVNMESTPAKIEKVRDLIDMYPDIPRLVVTGGCTPVDFFQHKLFYPLDTALYIGSSNRVGGSLMEL